MESRETLVVKTTYHVCCCKTSVFFLLRSLDLCPYPSQSLTHLLHLTAQRAEPQLDPEPLSSVCQNVSHIKDKPWLSAPYYRSWGLFPDQTLNGCAWHGWGQENTNSSCHLWLRLGLNIRMSLHMGAALQYKKNPVNHLYKQLITTCNYIFFFFNSKQAIKWSCAPSDLMALQMFSNWNSTAGKCLNRRELTKVEGKVLFNLIFPPMAAGTSCSPVTTFSGAFVKV